MTTNFYELTYRQSVNLTWNDSVIHTADTVCVCVCVHVYVVYEDTNLYNYMGKT